MVMVSRSMARMAARAVGRWLSGLAGVGGRGGLRGRVVMWARMSVGLRIWRVERMVANMWFWGRLRCVSLAGFEEVRFGPLARQGW